MRIAVLGGTGRLGPGLAFHFATHGHDVFVGSRMVERAEAAAWSVSELTRNGTVVGMSNLDAARVADVAVVTVPYSGLVETMGPLADALAGKVAVSTVVPVTFGSGGPFGIVDPAGSAAQATANLIPEARVTAALHSVSSAELGPGKTVSGDSIVCGDDDDACTTTSELVECIAGIRAVRGGPLALAAACEQMTVLLLAINRRYKAHAGLRVTGI